MAVLDTAGKVWAKIQEFIGRIDALEDGKKEHDGELKHLSKELELMRREMNHDEKVRTHLAQKVAEFEQRIKKLESEKHGAKVSAGIAKKKIEKLKDERRASH